jgi:hypothetical protein
VSDPVGGPARTQLVDAASETLADLAGILDEYLADLQANRHPDRAQLLAAHPELGAHLAPALEGLEFIHRTSAASPAAPARLGDFRIVGEVGRGGMGVVYEAEQISLRRRVAVKVLRWGAVADEQALADDLRAFLEGRPISARAPNLPQRIARWARKHRRTTAVAGFSAGVSLVLALGGYLVWQDHRQAGLARLSLSTDTPNLLAEIVDAQGQTLMPAFPVPSAEPVTVPAGANYLRLSASGLLSETWPVGRPAWGSDLIFDEDSLPSGGHLDEWRTILTASGLAHRTRDTELEQRTRDLNGDGIGCFTHGIFSARAGTWINSSPDQTWTGTVGGMYGWRGAVTMNGVASTVCLWQRFPAPRAAGGGAFICRVWGRRPHTGLVARGRRWLAHAAGLRPARQRRSALDAGGGRGIGPHRAYADRRSPAERGGLRR